MTHNYANEFGTSLLTHCIIFPCGSTPHYFLRSFYMYYTIFGALLHNILRAFAYCTFYVNRSTSVKFHRTYSITHLAHICALQSTGLIIYVLWALFASVAHIIQNEGSIIYVLRAVFASVAHITQKKLGFLSVKNFF